MHLPGIHAAIRKRCWQGFEAQFAGKVAWKRCVALLLQFRRARLLVDTVLQSSWRMHRGGGGQGRKHPGDCNAALLPSALMANTFGACCELSWSSGSAMASTLEAICLLKPSALPGPS